MKSRFGGELWGFFHPGSGKRGEAGRPPAALRKYRTSAGSSRPPGPWGRGGAGPAAPGAVPSPAVGVGSRLLW